MSLAQTVKIDSCVLVTTPQDIAVSEILKSISLFRSLGIPVSGIISNMDHFRCRGCGSVTEIFPKGRLLMNQIVATTDDYDGDGNRNNVNILGTVPILESLSRALDQGVPISDENRTELEPLYNEIGKKFLDHVQKDQSNKENG